MGAGKEVSIMGAMGVWDRLDVVRPSRGGVLRRGGCQGMRVVNMVEWWISMLWLSTLGVRKE